MSASLIFCKITFKCCKSNFNGHLYFSTHQEYILYFVKDIQNVLIIVILFWIISLDGYYWSQG